MSSNLFWNISFRLPRPFSLNKTDLDNRKRDYRTESAALSANFYDTKPMEKEREVFSAPRMASGRVTYDDIDF